jgi:hypothetical protein
MKIQSCIFALLLGGMPLSASAALVSPGVGNSVLAFTPGNTGDPGNGGGIGGCGWQSGAMSYPFSVTRPIEVTALANYSMFVASHVHLVTITDSAAPSVVLASADVNPVGVVDPISVNVAFAYQPITPVLLLPGHVYTMESVQDDTTPGNDFFYQVNVFGQAPDVSTTYPYLNFAGDFYYKLPATKNDFGGNGKSDILFTNTSTGVTHYWSGAVKTAASYPGAGAADFDGDGKADIFWRNATTGANQVWLGGQKSSMMYPGTNTDLTWKPVGAGDIDGDNHGDLVWYSPSTGAVRVWLGGMKANSTYTAPMPRRSHRRLSVITMAMARQTCCGATTRHWLRKSGLHLTRPMPPILALTRLGL